jgi:endogenous inhibitor of DNA gyrase (YacG/DUF329 family)
MCAGESVYAPTNPYRPFCSERCKLMDLGAWASDQYAIPGTPLERPLDEEASPQSGLLPPKTLQ